MSDDVSLSQIPSLSALSAEEAQFVYGAEVLGLPVKAAARMAGLPLGMVSKPHLQQAREQQQRQPLDTYCRTHRRWDCCCCWGA